MNQIIPLKKDIALESKAFEITQIDAEHDYKINENMVSGYLYISGSYIMTEASIIEEEFNYSIPFEIVIGDNVDKDTIKIIIDEFKYELHKDVLKIYSELKFTCDEVVKKIEEVIDEPIIDKEEINMKTDDDKEIIKDTILNTKDEYSIYKAHTIKSEDTIESICKKYNISKEKFLEYNDQTLVINDKVIIPENEI